MSLRQSLRKSPILQATNILTILGSIVILISLSTDIIEEQTYMLSGQLLDLQFAICLIFIFDYFARTFNASRKWHYFFSNIILLLVSIPYLNILNASESMEITKSMYIFLKCLPLIRGIYGIYYMIECISRNRLHSYMLTYVFIVLALSYLAALLFYAYENGVNQSLHGFGNALWWAGMNVTTVGASFFPVTAVGKTMAVILPGLGMIFFPLFTVYVTSLINPQKK